MILSGYERHAQLVGHKIVRFSPDAHDIIEECVTCGQRWLFQPEREYPLTLPAGLPAVAD